MTAVTKTLDASGLACPMPIVRTRQALDGLTTGDVLELISTDRGSWRDVPAWAESTGNPLLESREEDGRFIFLIQKG
jgi:tRNA 2-thiouridine synthesizing protein A